jgi:hypothetical protein
MTVDSVKLVIGADYDVVEFDQKLEEMIQKFDEDASYSDAYLIATNGDIYLVLEYGGDYTRVVNDSFDDGISDEDAYRETIENEIGDYFEDCEYDDRFYTMFKPLWRDIYYTIEEYGLDKEKFLNYFYTKDGLIDYDAVKHFKYYLDYDEIKNFITEIEVEKNW